MVFVIPRHLAGWDEVVGAMGKIIVSSQTGNSTSELASAGCFGALVRWCGALMLWYWGAVVVLRFGGLLVWWLSALVFWITLASPLPSTS